MKNKKAQIGSTLTWIVGFIVIFVIMLIFISATIAFAKVKGFSESDKVQYAFSYYSGPVIYSSFMVFLNTPIENKLTLPDILRKANGGERNKTLESIFKRECQKYIDSNFPVNTYGETFIALYSYDSDGFKLLTGYSCSNSLGVVSEAPLYSTLVHKVEVPIFKNKKLVLSVSKI